MKIFFFFCPGRRPISIPKVLDRRSKESEYPCTPPPSPRSRKSPVDDMSSKENLVFINVTMVDKSAANYATQYESVSYKNYERLVSKNLFLIIYFYFFTDESNRDSGF